MSLFRVKICGVMQPDDAAAVADAGADAIGLNFYRGSARYIDPQQALKVIAALPQGVTKVGVFVNADPREVRDLSSHLSLDYVQIHGDEPAAFMRQLEGLAVIRAFRLGRNGWQQFIDYIDECRDAKSLPYSILVDGLIDGGSYGGTGQSPDWRMVREYHDLNIGLPLILAGGLTPSNVGQAIRCVKPMAVDVASGVESQPGNKDREKVSAFIQAAREAFRSCQAG